jgi:dTMP kinase
MKSIKQHLLSGTHVIVDRYAYSGVAYSTAKGLDFEWCKSSDVGLITPDLVLFLDLPTEVAITRAGFGIERYENQEMQQRVREIFLKWLRDDKWVVIDASKHQEEVALECVKVVGCVVLGDVGPLEEGLWVRSGLRYWLSRVWLSLYSILYIHALANLFYTIVVLLFTAVVTPSLSC